jgi:hypothetical protein
MVLAMKIGLLAKALRAVRAHLVQRIQKTFNRCGTALAIVLGVVVTAAPSAQAQTFDAPGAGTGLNQGIFPTSINTSGAIAGIYSDRSNVYHGFVRAKAGTITEFNVTGGGTARHQGVQAPLSINPSGTLTGAYKDASDVYHGVVRSKTGAITSFEAPSAGTAIYQGTKATSISAAGEVTGAYLDAGYLRHGFVRSASGAFTEINAPGAATAGMSINTGRAIAGDYGNAFALLHGFVYSAKGVITSFDIPGAATGLLVGGTAGLSINTAGKVTGSYSDESVSWLRAHLDHYYAHFFTESVDFRGGGDVYRGG